LRALDIPMLGKMLIRTDEIDKKSGELMNNGSTPIKKATKI
jgi:hypothetical protein